MKKIVKAVCLLLLALAFAAGGVACGEEKETQKTGLGYEVDKSNMFGICVLPSDLPEPSRDPGVTTDIVCDLIEEMGVKSVRVWMHIPFVLERERTSNELSLKKSAVELYHNYFAMLKEAGVQNILVMSHRYLYPIEMIEPDYNGVIPDPEEQPDEYMAFMNLFRDCYSTLAEEFPEITLWEPNNETDHEKGTTIVRDGYSRENSQSGNAPYLYSPEEVAKITLDMCYYANLGIKEHNPENELVMPGLVFSSTSASSIFIELLYEQIESGELPTSMDEDGNRILPVDTNSDNYFNVLNWHPYANVKPNDDWLNANIDMYNVAVEHGDGGKKLFLSEFGWTDGFDEDRIEDIGEWYPEALDLLQENLPSLESVFCFRMFNYTTAGAAVADMEKTFGIFTSPVEEEGITPKPAALALFRYFNGADADPSALYKYAADGEAQLS